MPFLELQKVSYTYPNGHLALREVSLQIEKGERLAVIGQNGAGKTSAAKLMNGLNKPSSGEVIVDGWNTKKFTAAQLSAKVGYVFQNPDDQIFHNDVYQEIAYGPKNLKRSAAQIDSNVRDAAELLGIHALLKENPYDLPLSMRKFVTTASVIAMNSNVIILDEPTAGQDKQGLECLAQAIEILCNRGKTVITITHDMEFVANQFTRAVVMAEGSVIHDGEVRDIFWNKPVLQQAGLKPPYMSRLGQSLGFTRGTLTIEDFMEEMTARIAGQPAKGLYR